MSAETLLSVGIDLGTTTTQLVFSRLTVRNEGSAFSVPNYTVAAREVLRRSAVHFTPLRSERELDAEAIARIVDAEYAAAGIDRRAVQTGAVIITGETARRENARAVLEAPCRAMPGTSSWRRPDPRLKAHWPGAEPGRRTTRRPMPAPS